MKILIVEDEVISALALQKALQRRGLTVCPLATTGVEALRLAEEERPDAVLMDIQLRGDLDGVETARLIHSRFNIPVAFMTGYPDDEMMKRARIAEPVGYFIKPVDLEEVIGRLIEVLEPNARLEPGTPKPPNIP